MDCFSLCVSLCGERREPASHQLHVFFLMYSTEDRNSLRVLLFQPGALSRATDVLLQRRRILLHDETDACACVMERKGWSLRAGIEKREILHLDVSFNVAY